MATVCDRCSSPMRADDAFCGICGQATAPAPNPSRAGTPSSAASATRAVMATPGARAAVPIVTSTEAKPIQQTVILPEDESDIPESREIGMSVSGTLDPLFNTRYRGQLLRRATLYVAVAGFIDFVGFLLNLLISLMHGAFGLSAFVPVLWTLSVIVVFVVFWVLPVPALLGEWQRLLTFRAAQAATTLQYIQHALDRHHTPYDSLEPKPITPPGEGRRLFLELRRGFFAGYISSFAHGDDLYIGWTFWIYVSPLRALIMRLGRKVQDYTGRGNDIYQTLRYESTQATITAMHACTLEGIDFAAQGPYRPPPADTEPGQRHTPSPAPGTMPQAAAIRVPSAG